MDDLITLAEAATAVEGNKGHAVSLQHAQPVTYAHTFTPAAMMASTQQSQFVPYTSAQPMMTMASPATTMSQAFHAAAMAHTPTSAMMSMPPSTQAFHNGMQGYAVMIPPGYVPISHAVVSHATSNGQAMYMMQQQQQQRQQQQQAGQTISTSGQPMASFSGAAGPAATSPTRARDTGPGPAPPGKVRVLLPAIHAFIEAREGAPLFTVRLTLGLPRDRGHFRQNGVPLDKSLEMQCVLSSSNTYELMVDRNDVLQGRKNRLAAQQAAGLSQEESAQKRLSPGTARKKLQSKPEDSNGFDLSAFVARTSQDSSSGKTGSRARDSRRSDRAGEDVGGREIAMACGEVALADYDSNNRSPPRRDAQFDGPFGTGAVQSQRI